MAAYNWFITEYGILMQYIAYSYQSYLRTVCLRLRGDTSLLSTLPKTFGKNLHGWAKAGFEVLELNLMTTKVIKLRVKWIRKATKFWRHCDWWHEVWWHEVTKFVTYYQHRLSVKLFLTYLPPHYHKKSCCEPLFKSAWFLHVLCCLHTYQHGLCPQVGEWLNDPCYPKEFRLDQVINLGPL